MKDILTKGFYTGLGAGILLRDQIMNLLNAPVRVDDVPAQELRAQLSAVLQGISDQVGKSTQNMQHVGQEEVSDLLRRIGLARSEDVDALKERIADLEARLRREQEGHPAGTPHPKGTQGGHKKKKH